MKNKKGFTLVELIVVIVILGILAVIAVPAYNSYTEKAKINKEQTNVAAAYSIAYAEASEKFATDTTGDATGTSGTITVTCTSVQTPVCTATGGAYSWKLADGEVTKQ